MGFKIDILRCYTFELYNMIHKPSSPKGECIKTVLRSS